jgi:hypothetical protein
MGWKIRLRGSVEGLRQLEESFNDDPEVVAENEDYYIRSEIFERLDEPDEIRSEAHRIVESIRIFGSLDSLPVTDLETSVLVEENKDGTEHIYAQAKGVGIGIGSANPTIKAENEEIEVPPPADQTEKRTLLAIKDQKVFELANLISKGKNWVNLYRIFEFVQDNIESEDNIVDQGWWSRAEKERFKRTANSRDAIGDSARHGDSRTSPPTNKMSHDEAQSQINILIERWLKHREELLEHKLI